MTNPTKPIVLIGNHFLEIEPISFCGLGVFGGVGVFVFLCVA
jgi:hypothetical protein